MKVLLTHVGPLYQAGVALMGAFGTESGTLGHFHQEGLWIFASDFSLQSQVSQGMSAARITFARFHCRENRRSPAICDRKEMEIPRLGAVKSRNILRGAVKSLLQMQRIAQVWCNATQRWII